MDKKMKNYTIVTCFNEDRAIFKILEKINL